MSGLALLLDGFTFGAIAGAVYVKWSDQRYWRCEGFCNICNRLEDETA